MGTLSKEIMQQPHYQTASYTTTVTQPFSKFQAADHELKEAAEKAEREGSERPLVLQQLKTKIQLNRLQVGKPELKVEFEEPKNYELTQEEKDKQVKRRLRNRKAAKQSRIRKKKHHVQLEEENKELKTRQDKLKQDVKRLQRLLTKCQTAVKHCRICSKNHGRRCSHSRPPYSRTLPPRIPAVTSSSYGQSLTSSPPFIPGQRFVLNQNSSAPFMDVEMDNVLPSRPVSTPEAGSDRDSPFAQNPLTICIDDDSASDMVPVKDQYQSPQSTSFLSLLTADQDQGSLPSLPFEISNYDSYFEKQSLFVGPFSGSDRSPTGTLSSPDSPQSPQALFRAMQGLNHRGP